MAKKKKQIYKVKIAIDDDRWAKHPYGFNIYDEDGNVVVRSHGYNSRNECYKLINEFIAEGNEVDPDYEEYFY